MKKIIFWVIFFLEMVPVCLSQTWEWSENFSCPGPVKPIDMVVDQYNNIYMIGTYSAGALTIQEYSINNSGGNDGFLCKFSSSGNLLWLVNFGGNAEDLPTQIELINNELYILGEYSSNPIYFTPTSTLLLYDNYDSFLAKYDLNGNYISSIRIFYGNHIEKAKSMIYDAPLNSLIITGQFQNELKYNDGTSEITVPIKGPSGKDYFVIRTNLSGYVQDTAFIYSTNKSTFIKSINLSADGYFVSGDAFGTVIFNTTKNIISGGNADVFISKYDKNLNFLWARQGGGIGYDHVNSAASDKYGNLYVTGKAESTIVFDSTDILKSSSVPGFGLMDLYLAKYNKQGNLRWLKRKGSIGNDNGYGLALRENMVQFCGNIADTVIFNFDTLSSSSETDINTGFAIFSTMGDEIGAQGIGGSGTDIGEIITFNTTGSTLISGYFNSPEMVIGDSVYLNSSGTYDGFLASFRYPMSASFTKVTDITCEGDASGELIVTPYFGIEPYMYTWNHDPYLYDSTAQNLTAGNYSVTITDSQGDSAIGSIELSQPSPLTINADVKNVPCHPLNASGENYGEINLTPTGGSGSLTFLWSTLSGSGVNVSAEDQLNLTMGQYSVIVTDHYGCEASDTFIITQPGLMMFGNSIVTDEIVPPGNNGTINLTVDGGTLSFTYDWDGPLGYNAISEDISGLIGGNYNIYIDDSNDCSADTTFVVANENMLIAFISAKTDVDCNGNATGSATVGVTGGSDVSYIWSNGANTATINNLIAGNYFVTVTDNVDSDEAYASVYIAEPSAALTASFIRTHVKCYGESTGIIDLTILGGTVPYNFHWSNSAVVEDLVNVRAGDYAVTVTDANLCNTIVSGITLNEPLSALDISIEVDQPVYCNGDMTAILTANASGGTGTKTYLWDDPGNQTSQTATFLAAGLYHVTATDLNGCSIAGQINVTEPAPLSLFANVQEPGCFGGSDGVIDLSYSGGNGSNNYSWSGGQVSQDISGIQAGSYKVTVTDLWNCKDSLTVEVLAPDEIEIVDFETTDVTCFGGQDGSITITAGGGTGDYSYSVDGGSSFSGNQLFTGRTAGDYILVVLDENDCESDEIEVSVLQPEGMNIISSDATDVSCMGYINGTITIVAESPAGDISYSIDNGNTFENNNGVFTNLPPDEYNIILQDEDGCEQVVPNSLTVGEPEPVNVTTINSPPSGDQPGSIRINASGGEEPYYFYLFTADSDTSSGAATFDGLLAGEYHVFVIDGNSCISDTVDVTLMQGETVIVIYSAFSPNDDEVNDVWNIGLIELYPDCTVQIFNSWGKMVFTSDGYVIPWDGTYNNNDLPAGTYYYVIDLGDGSDPLSGHVSIVR